MSNLKEEKMRLKKTKCIVNITIGEIKWQL